MNIETLIQVSLYFLALINPASKVLILSSAEPPLHRRDLFRISAKATIAALVILLFLSTMGHFVLTMIFRVNIYALQIAGGIVLFIIGLNAVQKGRFFELDINGPAADISIVPLAAPMIAGPGTITAAISLSSTQGMTLTIISLTLAVMINFLVMLSSSWIGRFFERFHIFGPLIRITGLIVAAVAVQMILTGIAQWVNTIM